MKKVTGQVEDYLYDFYRKVGQQAGGIAMEKVMADALFKLAGELSLHALGKQKKDVTKKENRHRAVLPACQKSPFGLF